MDIGGCDVGKWFEKFRGLPCIQGACEILAGAEQPELLKLMIGMMKYCVLAEVFLELSMQASRKTGLLFEVLAVEAPLMFEEWLQVLYEGWW